MTGREQELAARLAATRERLAAACRTAGRSPQDVELLAVTKTYPLEDADALARAGQRSFGEARAQELAVKAAARPGWEWHFLGRLQSNKATRVGRLARVVHSLDRAELIVPLARGAAEAGWVLAVYLQVSLDGDPARGGCRPADLLALAARAATEPALRLAGLMAVPPQGQPPGVAFAALRELSERLRVAHPAAAGLSAGMSGDLEAAVENGATIVRVGSALLGVRGGMLR